MSRENFDDVTLCKHATAEQENLFIMFNFVSVIKFKSQNVRKSCDFIDDKWRCLNLFKVGKKCRLVIRNHIRWECDMGFCIFVKEGSIRVILCRHIINR